ncbi:ParB family chromosome partitioning protein [Arthrobacter sp. B3I9]|uniref:ParB/RepB/Spo0J family partition protein n=1 Tax=Arthrobacter sp. B3I9 TaxID=3042270 RepID=UPI002790A03D|nr:ParB/RepB/Spo0J family partition protein [Arthrobacter sp. B3I9]MDQ0848387.1 ParB family chromosome partitioning protein [Arthrobacter sp. B3I9]
MSDKRRGLGRGLGALIPSSSSTNGSGNGSTPSRPVDLFFPEPRKRNAATEVPLADELDAGPEAEAAESPTSLTGTEAMSESESPTAAGVAAQTAARRKTAANKSASQRAEIETVAKDEKPEVVPAEPVASAASAADQGAGRGPDAGPELVEVPGVRFAEIPVADIHPNRKQPRSVFDEDDMAELVHSVREIGVLQPIVVRTSTEEGGEPYELVMGERRWRAVQAAGLETIPAIVRDTTDDDLLRDALLENLHRSQLNPLEEAAAYQQLLEDFGTTHEQLADRIGRSRPQVSNTLRLLKLPPLVQRRVAASVISAGHARALLALPDAAAMERMAQKIVSEGMSVRATEEAVTLYQSPAASPKNNIPRPGARHERLDYLASSLSDRLDTNVKISLGARKGRVSIEFASVEDLNRIMDVLAPGPTG